MTRTVCHKVSNPTIRHHTPVFQLLSKLFSVQRTRQHLSRLDNHALQDLGLTPREAAEEANRSIWDVPASWRK